MKSLKEYSENLNATARATMLEKEQGLEAVQQARAILEELFDRFPESRGENGRPVYSYNLPRLTTPDGVELSIHRANYSYDEYGNFNIGVLDEAGVLHGYAQIWPRSKRINYWSPTDRDSRILGTLEQDQELIEKLKFAREFLTN